MRAASEYHLASHPEIVYQQAELLRGIYECLRLMLPAQKRPPESRPLSYEALYDLIGLKGYDEASMEFETNKAKERAKRRRP